MALDAGPGLRIVNPGRIDRSNDCPRTHGIYANAALRIFERQSSGHVLQSTLADGIREVRGFRDDFVNTRVVDDHTASGTRKEVSNCLTRTVERTTKVRTNNPVKFS